MTPFFLPSHCGPDLLWKRKEYFFSWCSGKFPGGCKKTTVHLIMKSGSFVDTGWKVPWHIRRFFLNGMDAYIISHKTQLPRHTQFSLVASCHIPYLLSITWEEQSSGWEWGAGSGWALPQDYWFPFLISFLKRKSPQCKSQARMRRAMLCYLTSYAFATSVKANTASTQLRRRSWVVRKSLCCHFATFRPCPQSFLMRWGKFFRIWFLYSLLSPPLHLITFMNLMIYQWLTMDVSFHFTMGTLRPNKDS